MKIIEVKNFSFRYTNGNRNSLENVAVFLPYSSSMLLSMATVYPALARRTTNKLCPMYKI